LQPRAAGAAEAGAGGVIVLALETAGSLATQDGALPLMKLQSSMKRRR
jgi:hypothetical protein